ncbi:MAG: aminoacyl-tRNA hydrolase [Syntrophotaleaceae bacterium]
MKIIAGLGNPGPEYAQTRHNIGFMAAERFASEHGLTLKKKGHQALYGVGSVYGQEVMVLLPQTYMNRSGASVSSACKAMGVPPPDLIVLHDEIDLPFGTLRIKLGGGHGGHNGLRNIGAVFGSLEFIRFRIGVDRPPAGGDVAQYVLRSFSSIERNSLDRVLENTAKALELLLQEGVQEAMNAFNNRDISL